MQTPLVAILIAGLPLAALACTSTSDEDKASSGDSGTDGGANLGDAGANPSDARANPSDAGPGDAARESGTDAGDGETRYSLPISNCFTFATASYEQTTTACGDFMARGGMTRVDLVAGRGFSRLCQLDGTFSSLADVPSSYDDCIWSDYIEGGIGLDNAGFVVDGAAGHHYRMRIVSNALPTLTFEFASID